MYNIIKLKMDKPLNRSYKLKMDHKNPNKLCQWNISMLDQIVILCKSSRKELQYYLQK